MSTNSGVSNDRDDDAPSTNDMCPSTRSSVRFTVVVVVIAVERENRRLILLSIEFADFIVRTDMSIEKIEHVSSLVRASIYLGAAWATSLDDVFVM
jgi:hypothetical protein